MGEGRGAIGVGKALIHEGIVLSWVGVVWAVVGAGVPDVGLGAVPHLPASWEVGYGGPSLFQVGVGGAG